MSVEIHSEKTMHSIWPGGMEIKKLLLAVLVLLVPVISNAGTGLLFSDDFSDGDVAGWYVVDEVTGGASSLSVNSAGAMSLGIATQNDENRYAITTFGGTTLTTPGDSVSLTFDFTITSDGFAKTGNDADFRIGLLDDNGSTLTGDIAGDLSILWDDTGYFIRISTGTEGDWDVFAEEGGVDMLLGGGNTTTVAKNVPVGGMQEGDWHTVKFVVTATDEGYYYQVFLDDMINAVISNSDPGGYADSDLVGTAITINELVFDSHDDDISFDIDNIIIEAAEDVDIPQEPNVPVILNPLSFADTGQFKMLYDRRQRSQALYIDGKVQIVFNAGGTPGSSAQSARTKPMVVTYDPTTRKFSEIVLLTSGTGSSDHHKGPVIWADSDGYLHVLYGCHKTPGTHIISKQPGSIGTSLDDWDTGPQIAPGISYPTVFSFDGDSKQVIHYRTGSHISSWTYRITDDNGQSWTGPADDVVDLDISGALDWSTYRSAQLSNDGNSLHVAFIAYDDNKTDPDPARAYNPRYDKNLSWKYNLYYIKINLQTDEVANADGETLTTPIDLALANSECMIWDTDWRGGNIVPNILIDANDQPGFLHVLSDETPEDFDYHYVRRENGQWKQTVITASNHRWNSSYLAGDDDGTLHAYLVTGDGYLDTGGYMDKHGGGNIEEWVSADGGDTWSFARDRTPDVSKYPGWRYNNIQPVIRPDGSVVEDMLLFYGWVDLQAPEAEAFLLHTVHWGDLVTLFEKWLNSCVGPDWCRGCDMNRSGSVDLGDFRILAEDWGR